MTLENELKLVWVEYKSVTVVVKGQIFFFFLLQEPKNHWRFRFIKNVLLLFFFQTKFLLWSEKSDKLQTLDATTEMVSLVK